MPKDKPTGVVVYILVDNIDETLEKAVKLGGKIVTPKMREGENFMTTIADPDGNLFGLYQYGEEAAP
ncbi:MAG: VOC family protein [Candidatus Bathyarchaeia archaeon]